MSDWLEGRAREERDRRLYGKEPGIRTWVQIAGDFAGWLVVGVVRWTAGLVFLAGFAALCLWGLIAIGNDKYILDCPGQIETRQRAFIRSDSLHLDVTEYGGITKLWADSDGSANSATAGGLFQFLTIKKVGPVLSFTGASKEWGHYTPLNRVIQIRLNDIEWFTGQCTERKPR